MLSVFRIVQRNEAYRGSFGLSHCQNYQSASLRTLIVVAGVFRPGKYRLTSKEHNRAKKPRSTCLVSLRPGTDRRITSLIPDKHGKSDIFRRFRLFGMHAYHANPSVVTRGGTANPTIRTPP